ncbi:uncharacterized protein LOC115426733 [Sphaeramia orbicularis]|uniref:uncharacterized protein LOC115426733 n=1 Tax=Sphaeramia orbicularis TaxID=375764 RepID=UPI0011812A25|nr:uncharacterized protein LOC115426733 [Sphaeramia orbicularis]
MDVESLQKSGRRRGHCLDTCLVISVVVLFVSVAAVGAGVVLAVRDLQSKVAPPARYPFAAPLSTEPTDSPVYKMQNFAYLEASSSELQSSTMKWRVIDYGAGDSLGSNFLFDSAQNSLKVKREGIYFMYVNLNFTCSYRCKAGVLSVDLDDKLTCKVELPEVSNSKPVTKKCWTVSWMDTVGSVLPQMTVPEGLENWKLELRGSGFGMFLVD